MRLPDERGFDLRPFVFIILACYLPATSSMDNILIESCRLKGLMKTTSCEKPTFNVARKLNLISKLFIIQIYAVIGYFSTSSSQMFHEMSPFETVS